MKRKRKRLYDRLNGDGSARPADRARSLVCGVDANGYDVWGSAVRFVPTTEDDPEDGDRELPDPGEWLMPEGGE